MQRFCKSLALCYLSNSCTAGCIVCSMDGLKELQRELSGIADTLCDVRLFAGRQAWAQTEAGEQALSFAPNAKELYETVQQLCGYMLRLSPEKTGQGFITLRGGHRMGLCGRVTQREGQLVLQEVGSACIRVAHQIKGCGSDAAAGFLAMQKGMLICGTPGSGKTTLLRDLVRLISDAGVAVGLSDERGEIAACVQGIAQLDVGARTHVLDGCPKAEALKWLLRSMCPQVLAMDELCGAAEYQAVRDAAACGVRVIATVHAGSMQDIQQRAGLQALVTDGVFRQMIFVQNRRIVRIEETSCCGQ